MPKSEIPVQYLLAKTTIQHNTLCNQPFTLTRTEILNAQLKVPALQVKCSYMQVKYIAKVTSTLNQHTCTSKICVKTIFSCIHVHDPGTTLLALVSILVDTAIPTYSM